MNFKVTRATDGDMQSAVCPFPAPRGLIVNFDPADPTKWKKATGTKGFNLERDVVTEISLAERLGLASQTPVGDFVTPDKVNVGATSARQAREIEVEGNDLILTSGTGAVSGSTAARTELSTNQGRLSVKQSGEEVFGRLVAQLTPETAGNVRIVVEVER